MQSDRPVLTTHFLRLGAPSWLLLAVSVSVFQLTKLVVTLRTRARDGIADILSVIARDSSRQSLWHASHVGQPEPEEQPGWAAV